MRYGAQFWRFDIPEGPAALASRLSDAAAIFDADGAETLWLMDHFFQMEASLPADQPMLEGYTTLGFLAARTTTARLGLLATCATYRPPAVLAKIVSTLDVLSGGRATLGIGAGWYEREQRGLGLGTYPTAERFERLEETLRITTRMFDGITTPYEGRHHQLAEPLNIPAPLRRPPILVAGSGPTRTMRLVARYGDACNLFPQSPAFVADRLDALRRWCDTEHRDYDSISKTLIHPGGDDALDTDAFLRTLQPYADLGIETVHIGVGRDPVAFADRFTADTAPRLADL